jgi:hypothetical protein
MKKSLFFALIMIISVSLQAQKDTVSIAFNPGQKSISTEATNANISIFPVPVRENYFSIRCDKNISSVRITNIIGQDVYSSQYSDPQTVTKIILDNPKRGMYLVSIKFHDGSRIVKKIMIEQTE